MVGVAVTVAPVLAESDDVGAQLYVVAPEAVRLILPPGQIEVDAVTVTFNPEFTVTIASAKPAQPVLDVPVTLYVVMVVGLASTVDPVVDDNVALAEPVGDRLQE